MKAHYFYDDDLAEMAAIATMLDSVMADKQLVNPIGEEGEGWNGGLTTEYYQYDPATTATTLITAGMVLIISGGYLPGTGDQTSVNATNYAVVNKATTSPAFTNIGVAIDVPGTTTANTGYVPGNIVAVAVGGIVPILCDANNTTFGQFLIAGSTTAGAATAASTPTAGKTIAVCLQTATIGSGTAMVYGKLRLI